MNNALSEEQKRLKALAEWKPPVIREPVEIVIPPVEPELTAISAAQIAQTDYRPLDQPVRGLIVEGLTLLVGASKIGKSWLVLDMCLSVAAGADFLGRQTMPGTVLYLALEDSERRLKSRMQRLSCDAVPSTLYMCTDALTLGNGIEEQLGNWIKKHPDTKLIVIDTLQMIRSTPARTLNAYQADYGTMRTLKGIADESRIAIVLIHHTNKLRVVTDSFDKISGSTGLMGAADTTILVDRERSSNEATVQVVGRDVCVDDFLIAFDEGRWRVVSESAQAHAEEQAYDNNPIVQIFRAFITRCPEGGRWSYDEVKTIGSHLLGYPPFVDAKDFIKRLKEVEKPLVTHDGIICTPSVRAGNKRGILLTVRRPITAFQAEMNTS